MHLERPTVVALDDDRDRLRRRDVVARPQLFPDDCLRLTQLRVEDLGQLGRVRSHRHSAAHARDTHTVNPDFVRYWPLDPDITYLNHGSFGSCPWPVLQQQSEWRARMERRPISFLDAELEGHLDHARSGLAQFIGADPDDVAFVPNATTGVNTVLRSLELAEGDEILTTDHEYNACLNSIRFVAGKARARTVVATIALPIM